MSRRPAGAARAARSLAPLFLLFAGAFVGRVASEVLPSGPLGVFDLAIYVGLALSAALAYRRFARRTLADRRRDRERRARFRERPDEERG